MTDLDIDGICQVLDGKVRGKPVAVSLFHEEIPQGYVGREVAPCAILRYARDNGELCYFDRKHQNCLHGAYITGVHEGTEQIRTGRLLPDYVPAYTETAGYALNSGEAILPQGTVLGMGAAPLDQVPDGIDIAWLVIVCTPFWASSIAAARSVEDGVQPAGAAGSSFCTDSLVTPWYHDNVVMTPGDVGGRMNNRLKPDELFVVLPTRWANNLVSILGQEPDVKGLYEATLPADAKYWTRREKREAGANAGDHAGIAKAESLGLKISMDWEDDALTMIGESPRFVRKFAVGNVEDFAQEKSYTRITTGVVTEQMESAGATRYLRMFRKA
jgi:uncharacterized protein (DUF169 family)